MRLSSREITLILNALEHKYGSGYSNDKEVGQLQAKLSIMLEVALRMEQISEGGER